MDHRQIEDDDIVERYLLAQLSEGEKAEFEAHYFGCQRCLDELELAEARLAGAKQLAAAEGPAGFAIGDAADQAAGPAEPAEPAAPPTLGPLFSGPLATAPPPPRLRRFPLRKRHFVALAALLLLAIGTPLYLRRDQLGEPAAVLDLERGSESAASTRIALPAQGPLVLALQLTEPLADEYRARLYRLGGSEPVWQADELESRGELLKLGIPLTALTPAEYLMRLQTPDESDVGYYRFAITGTP